LNRYLPVNQTQSQRSRSIIKLSKQRDQTNTSSISIRSWTYLSRRSMAIYALLRLHL